ncbi:hypothetical protein B0T16DRAFT_404039 [Cercophora newfieldiana]|uniref:Protamine P1 n=1 Tax=Cercophora newfieldiana TaxID=92897 RepID=A0AA39YHA6_9PEZI|nr:hypothetical protein B0T16DRAFT_404039 [Cercophora newfieldiana]
MKSTGRVRAALDRALLEKQQFRNEPIYCDARENGGKAADDVLLSGSDDEAYDSPTERRLRCEKQALRFIEGKPLNIFSAALRGPFDKESGWTNPWRSRSQRPAGDLKKRKVTAIEETPRPTKKKRAEVPNTQATKHAGCGDTTAKTNRYLRNWASSVVVPGSSFQYMDDEAASRVIDWAESIVAEDGDDATASAEGLDEQIPTQQGPTPPPSHLVTVGDATVETLSSPSVSNVASGSPTSKSIRVPSEHPKSSVAAPLSSPPASRGPTRSPLEVVPSTKSDKRSNASREQAITAPISSGSTELSPEALRIYREQTLQAANFNRTPLLEKGTPVQTTVIAAVAASLSSVRDADISYHTFSDRSFRFKSKKKLRRKSRRSTQRNVVSADPPNTENEGGKDLDSSRNRDATPSGPVQVDDCVTLPVDVQEPGSPHHDTTMGHDYEQIYVHSSILHDKSASSTPAPEIVGPDVTDKSDTSAPPSITAPRLPELRSPLNPGAFNLMGLGTFSWEKQQSQRSQSPLLAELPGMPRKLLWPRSLQQAPDTSSDPISLPPFEWTGPNSSASDIPVPPEPAQSQSRKSENTSVKRTTPDLDNCSATIVAQLEDSITAARKCDGMDSEKETLEETPNGPTVLLGSPAMPQARHCRTSSPVIELGSPVKPGECVPDNRCPIIQLGSPIKPTDQLSADARPTIELGSPVKPADTASDQQQSPWSKEATKTPQQPEEIAAGEVAGDSAESVSSKPQSPWAGITEIAPLTASIPKQTTTLAAKPQTLKVMATQELDNTDEQSPWAKGDSQVAAIVQPRLFNPLSSPAASPRLPEATELGFPSPRPLPDEGAEMIYSPRIPSTPTRYNSSLPTPEFTLSIKSFREFMTPSPVKQRTPLGPADSNGRLPSTQILAEAAASNPWTGPSFRKKIQKKKPKKTKRVSWAPLPGEEPASSPTSAECPASPGRSRPASPPPSSLIAPEEIPAENQKFGRHFAAVVANRRRRSGFARRRSSGMIDTPLARTPKAGVSLLPSASQQVCESPAPDAMAEAFIQADEGARAYSEGLEEAREELAEEGMEGLGNTGGAEEGMSDETPEEEEEQQETQQTVDDVTDVLDNLDDFLDRWDVNAELANIRAENKRKEKEKREKREKREANGGFPGLMDIGLMDVGVWD